MNEKEFKKKLEEIRDFEKEYIVEKCNKSIIEILQNNNYSYNIISNGLCISLKEHHLYIGLLDFNKSNEYTISFYNYNISRTFYINYDDMICEDLFLKDLKNMIAISKTIEI